MEIDHWIFISPHLDDVVLSCGGLVWSLTQAGQQVSIWTILAGDPPDEDYSAFARENHAAWGKSGAEAIAMRRAEDEAACKRLGSAPRHFDLPDVIYRRHPQSGEPVVHNNDELFGLSPEPQMVSRVAALLASEVPPEAKLVLPIGLGGHIDHHLVASAGEKFHKTAAFYLDYPYILKDYNAAILKAGNLQKIETPLYEDSLAAWQDAVLCYPSQIGGFWRNAEETRLAYRNFMAGGGGRLWVKI
jgi:LmbE family N-acetylglucosaminyl deacetylase